MVFKLAHAWVTGMFAGSAITGHWFKDQVRIGDSFQNNTAVEAKMGCHDSEAWLSGEHLRVRSWRSLGRVRGLLVG